MISFVDKNKIVAVRAFCSDSILGTKIFCFLSAYGLERDFCQFWLSSDEDGAVNGVILKFESSLTLSVKDGCDYSELSAFLGMTDFDELVCEESVADKLNLNGFRVRKSYSATSGMQDKAVTELKEMDIYKAYKLISENIPDSFADSKEAYLSFLSDFTFRRTRGFSRMKGIRSGDEIISCAMTSAETDKAAIMSGIASDASKRRKGLGRATVLHLAGELINEGKKAYVIALNESAEGFYEHIGFEYETKIAFYERKN